MIRVALKNPCIGKYKGRRCTGSTTINESILSCEMPVFNAKLEDVGFRRVT